MTQSVFETTATALREKSKLRRHFRRFDVFFYLICTVVTIDTIGAVASNGAQGFTWLIFLGICFFLPPAAAVRAHADRAAGRHRRCRRSLLPPGRQDAPGDGRRAGRAGLCPG